MISVTSSVIGQVVETERIESLPLNGRQFANLAATVPGVGLGFHSDLVKSTPAGRFDGITPYAETQQYVAAVQASYEHYKSIAPPVGKRQRQRG